MEEIFGGFLYKFKEPAAEQLEEDQNPTSLHKQKYFEEIPIADVFGKQVEDSVYDVQYVIVAFSAQFCPPCEGFHEPLKKFHDEFKKDGRF